MKCTSCANMAEAGTDICWSCFIKKEDEAFRKIEDRCKRDRFIENHKKKVKAMIQTEEEAREPKLFGTIHEHVEKRGILASEE